MRESKKDNVIELEMADEKENSFFIVVDRLL
jgi:hypothetical protein